jgi:hypothetical protein
MHGTAAEQLWAVIEDKCRRSAGRSRPIRHISRRTGIPSSTVSDWFRARAVPELEKFDDLLRYFPAEWHEDLRTLWRVAWEETQQERSCPTASGEVGKTPPATANGAWRVRRPSYVIAGCLVLVILVGGAVVACRQFLGTGGGDVSTIDPPPRRCAFVISPTSPVYVSITDPQPLKHKFRGDTVRLVDLPPQQRDSKPYVAVALPTKGESDTGYGWMPEGDLRAAGDACGR